MLRRNSLLGSADSVKLPTGYTKLQYLDNGGNSYIDTGFKPNQNTRLIVDIELGTQSSYPKSIFGSRNGSETSDASFIVWAITAEGFRTDFGSKSLVTTVAPTGRFVIDKDKNVTSFNGITYTNTSYTFQSNYNIGLFSQIDVDGVDTKVSSAKIYSCIIYDNGIKVRDYIPCTNFYGKSGLYDTVNKVFYPLIPAGYTLLEYLESDGNGYIDTGFKPNNNTRVIFEGYNNNANSKWLFGTWNASNTAQFGISLQNGAGVRYGSQKATITYQDVGDVFAELDKNKYTFNDLQGTLNDETFTCSYNIFIGALNQAGTPTDSSYSFIGRIYSVKIYDNGTLVRDYMPAKNSSGTSGLYDLVNNVFYTFKQIMTFTWSIVSGSWTKGTQSSAVDGVKYTSVSPGDSGSTRLRCTFSGVTSITFNCVYNGESNYDYLTVGSIDTACTRNSYGTTLKGTSGTAKNITFSCTTASHYVEFCYSKDGSVDTSPDCAVVYIKSAS